MGDLGWQKEALLAELEGDEEELRELLAVFKASSQKLLNAIKEALEEGRLLEAREQAHALKGACGTIFFTKAQELSLALEKAPDLETAKEIFDQLYKLLEKFIKELESFTSL